MPTPGSPASSTMRCVRVATTSRQLFARRSSTSLRPISRVPAEARDERGDRCSRERWRGRRRRVERARLPEDLGLQGLQRGPRFEPELVGEALARAQVDVERLGLAPAAVEGDHELRRRALARGMLGRERLELAHERRVAAELRGRRRRASRRRSGAARRGAGPRSGRTPCSSRPRAARRARARAPARARADARAASPAASAARPSATRASNTSASSSPGATASV